MSAQVLVFGTVGDGLVFVNRDQARELAALWTGFGTWAQARAALSPQRWADIVDRIAGAEESLPAPEEPFDLSRVPGNTDGDWPEWPAQQMLDWFPADLAARFGRAGASVLNGDFLDLDPRHEDELVAALEDTGWVCLRDGTLVRAASGILDDQPVRDSDLG